MAVVRVGVLEPIRELFARVGETRAIAHQLEGKAAIAISAATITVWDSAGTAVVTAQACTVTPGTSAKEQTIEYAWNTTGVTAGDFTYQIRYTLGSESLAIPGFITVAPQTTKYDRWVAGMVREMDQAAAEAQRLLGYRHFMQAADRAVRRYEQDRPLLAQVDISLTDGLFEYALSGLTGWANEFSRIESFEYPVDDTKRAKVFLEADGYTVDELRAKWRFENTTPGTGESARITFTKQHTLSHTSDTIPAKDFEAVCKYAAGEALEILANRSAGTSAPGSGADVVNFRSKQQEYRQQAKDLRESAVEDWQRGLGSAAAITSWDYLSGHGAIYSL